MGDHSGPGLQDLDPVMAGETIPVHSLQRRCQHHPGGEPFQVGNLRDRLGLRRPGLEEIERGLDIEHMFVSYNPAQTDSIPSLTDSEEFIRVLDLDLFVDRLATNADAGQTVGGFEDTATRHAGLVEEAGGVAHPKNARQLRRVGSQTSTPGGSDGPGIVVVVPSNGGEIVGGSR
jgi:hypothetical protein